jgi:transposase
MPRRRKPRRPLPRKKGWRDVPDEFWAKVEPLIPEDKRSRKGGRPPIDHRKILDGVLYVLRTGCQWKMLPREYGSGSTAHRHFQAWVRKGVFGKLWKLCLEEYDDLRGIDWEWQSIDSATVPAPVKGGIARAGTPRTGASSARSATFMSTAMASLWA